MYALFLGLCGRAQAAKRPLFGEERVVVQAAAANIMLTKDAKFESHACLRSAASPARREVGNRPTTSLLSNGIMVENSSTG